MRPPGSVGAAVVAWAAATCSGALVFLAFPAWNLHALAWFAHVPLLFVARQASPRRAWLLGWWAGTVTNFGGFHWMPEMLHEFGHLPWPVCWAILLLQAVVQGLTVALGLAAWRWLAARGVPSAWAAWLSLWGGEALVPMIFPWFLGNGVIGQTRMVQIADLGGVHLVSAVVYAANVALAEPLSALASRRPLAWRMLATTGGAVAATWLYGGWRVAAVDAEQAVAPRLRVGLVEGNVGIWEKEARHLEGDERVQTLHKNLLKHQRASAALAAQGADLIVWPESAYQPQGAVPVVFGRDHFGLIGAGGTMLRSDGATVTPRPRAASLSGSSGRLLGLSSPRADVWRMLEDGRVVHTVAPWHRQRLELSPGEQGVDTAAAGITALARMHPGVVATRSGRVYALEFVQEPARPSDALTEPEPALRELPFPDRGDFSAVAVAMTGAEGVALVGAKGALAELRAGALVRVPLGVTADFRAIAADPLGLTMIAVGDGGEVARDGGGGWVRERPLGVDLQAAVFEGSGRPWLAGAGGVLFRGGGTRWERIQLPGAGDLRALAADSRGHLLALGADGGLWQRDAAGQLSRLASGTTAELTDLIGFTSQATWSIPRMAQRLPPSRAPLPDPGLTYPADVLADADTPAFDRSTPRRGFDVPLLFGAATHGGELPLRNNDCRACYNSALLLDRDGAVLDVVDKAFLLVFGEYMPFGEELPELYELLPASSRFQPGTRTTPMRLGAARIGVLVCYEDLLPRFARRVLAHNPNILINLTNDAWFGRTAEPYHHLQLAQMRAVEYRRWLVRSTNTGVSVFVDAVGRRVAETSLDDEETLLQAVPLLEAPTLYARLGDWPLAGLALGWLALAALALRPSGGSSDGSGRSPRRPAKRRRAASASAPATSSQPGAGA